ncbi:MAG: ADOP family duplicated permease [Gemmatimonadota bacterium]
MNADSAPPALASWLLTRILPEDFREACLGDLEERFRNEIVPARGAAAARRWYWGEVLRAPIALLQSPRPSPRFAGDSSVSLLAADLHFATRTLRRRPAFTTLVVLILGLGIGATTAIFSAVYPILFASLPYPDASRITMIWESTKDGGRDNVGFTTWRELTDLSRSFEATAAVGGFSGTMTGRSEPEQLVGQKVTESFFRVLGVSPAIGRGFSHEEDRPGAARVVILSDALWRRRFGGDSSIVGRDITIDGNPFAVVGIMPASFVNVLNPAAQLYTPLRYDVSLPYACRGCHHLRAVARLRAGVTTTAAARELEGIYATMRRDHPTDYAGVTLLPVRLQDDITRAVRPALLAVLAAAALVLLIACANVTNLLLGRAAQRRGEFALRAALGASRGRVMRQLLTESLLLSGLGGALGVALAVFGVRGLVALSPAMMPRVDAIALNSSALGFALAISLAVGVIFGLVPAWHATRRNLHQGTGAGSRRTAGGASFTRGALVISEVALALLLLVGSGLLLRSMREVLNVDPGFDAEQLLTVQIQSGGQRMPDDATTWRFFEQVLTRVRALPGVTSAALTSQLPLSNDFDGYGIHSEKHPNPNPSEDPSAFRYGVSAGYLETMRIPLLRGRTLTPQDVAGQPEVVVINQSFAKRVFPGEDAIGQRVRVGDPAKGPWRTIVGIVGDVKQVSLAAERSDALYQPEVQSPYGADGAMTLVVRGGGDVNALLPAIRQAVAEVDRDQPVIRVATMAALLHASEAQRRFALVLFEGFALVALILAAAGIYGVLSGMVTERIREIGVRSALGASRRDILSLIVGAGMRLTGIGLTVGLVASVLLSRTIASMLFGITATDLPTYLGVALVLFAVAIAACWLPARRAARIDPVTTLRAD